ncbi:formate--tetrahydrofolate ligase, partial [Enterococcus faecalis]|nr:formate--tetrahydrofolate ligase [Enterococcus faecalis]
EKIIVGYNFSGEPVTAGDLKAAGAMAALLKDAIHPNLVQTLEHTPAIIHGGPFANIAHGCNSVLATKMALKYADYAVTEAGFGADLGAEKFIDIKCRLSGLRPAAVVLVATIRALKMHGGVQKADLGHENVQAVVDGLPNLDKHLENIQEVYGLPVVVAINKFPLDTDAELAAVYEACQKRHVDVVISDVWANGGAGGKELAEKVVALAEEKNNFNFVYDESDPIETKLQKLVTRVYGGKGISLTPAAKKEIAELERLGFGHYPICMAKTQYSFSDDPKQLGAPKDFTVKISSLKVSAGAGFIVALTGAIMTMPGLPKAPASE